ncbi:cobaltochelatase subunit CobN [Catelliglobosispora koreensis]|uniref:cobaltochelatase subunit CobN n=1 Tax=Catelliglobosispora koreensis TaxID=129052 RepID=UPI000376F48A|nr:cobaltochelatase subunit CobN [Catelliglobosispora koreensis]
MQAARGLLLSTADTELLAASASGAPWRIANPTRLDPQQAAALARESAFTVVRLLGGQQAWPEGLSSILSAGTPCVVLGGEAAPDAALQALSTAPSGVVSEALAYLAEGGVDNLRELHRFLSDTLLMTGDGFEPPRRTLEFGVRPGYELQPGRPTVGVIYYRAHELAGNAGFVDTLCEALQETGANAHPVYCASLRSMPDGLRTELSKCDALIVTVLAAGGTKPADAAAGGDEEAWSVEALAALDVPIVQGLCLTSSRSAWEESDAALSPMDAAMQVAIPEFDGRLITVPFSFKEPGPEAIPVYVADPERARRVAGIAFRYARLRYVPNASKRLAIVLSSYPTKHSRVGNAVGLDTPASAVILLRALREAGYDLGDGFPEDSDELIHTLIAAGGHDVEWLTEEQLANAPARVPLKDYRQWLTGAVGQSIVDAWGEPPGSLYVDGDDIVLASLRFGNVILMIQPPRGFGENPIAIYHDPALAPSHHYLAAYRWLDHTFKADAVVHLGKHGTLEWLPGKGLGLSADCAPDAVLGDLPLVYPFIVNDPGEGTQAKRRGHATIIDHLVPPMARAETYGEMAKLEQLLDEYATVQALDPAKLPAVRAQIWTLVQEAKLHHDLHQADMPEADEFDDFIMHIDGYLCEVKDSQIRDGLHILGAAPQGEARVNLVLAILRASQVWGGVHGALPGLRTVLGLEKDADLATTDRIDAQARLLVEQCERHAWDLSFVDSEFGGQVKDILRFAAAEVVPRLDATAGEVTNVLRALDGRFIPPGPSGSPTRGLVNVLPTGRNFYSVDPKAIPSRNAWDVGVALAESLLRRHREDTGEWPRTVGLTVWGTSAMRTQGDDIAEVLALLGCRPTWDAASRRVTGIEVIPAAELGRPRVDVTVRISGFFRDAFPHAVTLIDDAITAVAALDEGDNFVREHALSDVAEHGDWRRATTRIFGSKPGAYGAGLLPLIDARNWRDDKDLAEVYAVWGGYAYGRQLDGKAARADLERVYKRVSVAAKNIDTREHDIVDSDDYFQYHGGMVAMVRALTGESPAAFIGDSHVPEHVKTRTLAEETKRVFRARVVNPRWIAAMQRHGYKGAFELAATVDYLFGYDATAGVVDDWMYENLATSYVFDPGVRKFLEKSNPWALRGITERLLEAADRGLWAEPDPDTIEGLREVYLATEGDLEA